MTSQPQYLAVSDCELCHFRPARLHLVRPVEKYICITCWWYLPEYGRLAEEFRAAGAETSAAALEHNVGLPLVPPFICSNDDFGGAHGRLA